MREWKRVRLKDVASNASRAFDFRRKATAIFINTGDVLGGYFLHSELSRPRSLPGQATRAGTGGTFRKVSNSGGRAFSTASTRSVSRRRRA